MVELTAGKSRKQIEGIEQLMGEMGVQIQAKLPKVYSKDLVEVLFKLPYTKRHYLEAAGLGNLKTAGNYLRELEEAGFLKSEQLGKEKLYLNYRLLEVLKGLTSAGVFSGGEHHYIDSAYADPSYSF